MMPWPTLLRLITLALCLLSTAPIAALAQQAGTTSTAPLNSKDISAGNINADQARQTLDVLQDDARRQQLIQVLETIANAPASATAQAQVQAQGQAPAPTPIPAQSPAVTTSPATNPAATSSNAKPAAAAPASPPAASPPAAPAAAPAAPAQTAPAAPAEPASPLQADSLGAQLLEQGAAWLEDAGNTITETVRNIADLPRIWSWLVHNFSDPKTRGLFFDAVWRLAVVIGSAVIGEYALRFMLRRPLYLIEKRAAYLYNLRNFGSLGSVDAAFEPDEAASNDPAETTPSAIDPGSIDPGAIDSAGIGPAAIGSSTATMEPGTGPAAGQQPVIARDASGLPKPTARWWLWLRRIPWSILHFALALAPIILFAVIGNTLLGTDLAPSRTIRAVGIAAVNAYVLTKAISALVEFFVISRAAGLRLLPVQDETAAYIEIWTFRIAGMTLFGVGLTEIALLLGMPRSGHDTLLKIVLLVVAIFTVIIILQSKHRVAQWLRAKPGRTGPMASVLNRLAASWHVVAIFLVLAFWLVWAMQIQHGFTKLLNFCLILVGVLVAARIVTILLHAMFDRLFHIDDETEKRFPGLKLRANRYYPVLRAAISFIVLGFGIVALLQAWGIDAFDWFHGDEIGSRLLSAVITVALSAIIACAVWEGSNIAIDRHMMRLDHGGDYAHAARLRTLVPIMRTVLLIIVSIVVILTILSEIGVNIAPLLAGASIVGVAIGFGSQKLVQDFITGIFLLLENAMQVGDSITASGLSGTVEKLSIRTIRLRAGDGAVHIIPFSSVGTVTNVNRGVGNAAVKVSVAASEDYDKVGEVLKAIAKEMRQDENFRRLMRSDLQLWGVDEVQAGAITIAGQIVCSDSGRWGVQREFNRRLLKRFAELGIKLASPSQYLVLAQSAGLPGGEDSAAATEDAGTQVAGGTTNAPEKKDPEKKDSPTSLRNSPPPTALGHTE